MSSCFNYFIPGLLFPAEYSLFQRARPASTYTTDGNDLGGNVVTHLRTLRKRRGWTQSELGKKSNIPPSSISRLERNAPRPSRAAVVAVSKALEVHPLSIQFGRPPTKPPMAKTHRLEITPAERHVIHSLRKHPGSLEALMQFLRINVPEEPSASARRKTAQTKAGTRERTKRR